MFLLWMLWSWAGELPEWRLENTGIYRYLYRSHFALGPSRIYVFHVKSQSIQAYDRNGQPQQRIAGPGPGPGELSKVNRIVFADGKLFAVGSDAIQYYDAAGNYLGIMKRSERFGGMFKTASGWINAPFKSNLEVETITAYDEALENPRQLARWETGLRKEKFKGTTIELKDVYNTTIVKTDADHVFLWRSDKLGIIQVFDTNTPSKPATITLDMERGGYEKGLMTIPIAKPKPPIERKPLPPGLPELPVLGSMISGPGNQVYWFPPSRRGHALVIDAAGKQYQAVFTPDELRRIVAEEGDLYYVIYQDPNTEELAITRLHKDKAKSFMLTYSKDQD